MYRQEEPRSASFAVQAVSESISPENGAVGGVERPVPPQDDVPGAVVYLSDRGPRVVVVVLDVVVVVGAVLLVVVVGAVLLVVVVAAPLLVVVVAAPLLVVVVAAPLLVVVVAAPLLVVVVAAPLLVVVVAAPLLVVVVAAPLLVVVVAAPLLVVVVAAPVVVVVGAVVVVVVHSVAPSQVPPTPLVLQVHVVALHAAMTVLVQAANAPPLSPDSAALGLQFLLPHGGGAANEDAALSHKAATTVIVRVTLPMTSSVLPGDNGLARGQGPRGPR